MLSFKQELISSQWPELLLLLLLLLVVVVVVVVVVPLTRV